MTQAAKKKSFKDTLNLPKTSFSMKANLVQNEPASIKRWQKQKLYEQVRQARAGSPRYVFHDGPPYANGSIHLGHLLNKVLKDFVVRTKSMAGFDCPYVPGWDCHGLPIEHKVMQERQGQRGKGAEGQREDSDAGAVEARVAEAMAVRKDCQKYASKFVKLQAGQMQRLLTIADYDNPYLTMVPAYEAAVLEVFAELVGRGLVYRMKKPVHWSIDNQTALADAELEYEDREDVSVYVNFELSDPAKLPAALNMPAGRLAYAMIWTTTPWTLPANLAVAVHEKFEYGLYRLSGRGEFDYVVLATSLADRVFKAAGFDGVELLGTCDGRELVGLTYRHPFVEERKSSPIVAADYVTLEDGTGLVHTAPGHGVEDYQTGLREGLDIYCPVQEDGTFDDTAPDWLRGQSVWKANDLVTEHLRKSGHLFFDHKFTHSYPHDWRSKGPVIFRATEQWFVDVNKGFNVESDPQDCQPLSLKWRALVAVGFDRRTPLTDAQKQIVADHEEFEREMAIERMQAEKRGEDPAGKRATPAQIEQFNRAVARTPKIARIKFFPEWGRNRMRGMLESRPDWCLSRQRAWGLPIPAFFGPDEGQVLLTPASVRAVADVVRQRGSDVWFKADAAELLADYDPAADPDAPDWVADTIKNQKSKIKNAADIFDVWFESGSSWNACIRQRGLALPDDQPAVTDLYLEGSDQHRGWFQLSLLPCLGVLGKSPFAAVLTHGFMVDKDGKKISKSDEEQQKRIPSIDDLFSQYGADIARWWVASQNTDNDIKVDIDFFKHAGDEYRKIRNTLRFLLGNLADFDLEKHAVSLGDVDARSLDAWALAELRKLVAEVRDGYERFHFRKAHEAIFNFCNDTMSAVYLAATKDRLYCDKPDSPRRRRTQTVMHHVCSALIRLIAPLLPHTADEAWAALRRTDVKDSPSVHLELFPLVDDFAAPCDDDWPLVMDARDDWMKHIEESRQKLDIDNPLDVGLDVPKQDKEWLAKFDPVDLADLCGISRFALTDGDAFAIHDLRDQPRCERSWKRDATVQQFGEGDEAVTLSARDADAIGLA